MSETKEKQMSRIKDGDRVAFWRSVKQLYDDGQECDAKLVCRGGEHVLCHRLVLASVSKFMRRVFKRSEAATEDKVFTVCLPDLEFDAVRAFVNFLYGILAMTGLDFNVEPEVVVALGADLRVLNLPSIPAVEDIGEDEEESEIEKPKSAALTKKLPFRLVLSGDGSSTSKGKGKGIEGPKKIAHLSLLVPKKNLPKEKRKRSDENSDSPAAKRARTDEEKAAATAKNWPKVYEVKGKELKCEHCEDKFENWGDFKDHSAEKHPDKTMWGQACTICNRLFFLKSDLNYHIKAEHREEGPHKCQESGCKANYLTKASLARHMRKFHGEGARKWKTRNLVRFPHEMVQKSKKKRGRGAKVENRRTIVDEATGQKKYLCEVCGREDSNLQTHYLHMKEHRDVNCDECGRTFHGLKRLNMHMAVEHPQPKIECNFCSKMYGSKAALQLHITRVHTSEEDRPKLCMDCGKRFANSGDLKNHRIQAHDKTRPVVCRYGCGASYKEHSSRNGHEKKQHGGLFQGGGTERHIARQQQQQEYQQQQQQQQRQQTKRQQRRQTQRQQQAETRAAVAAIQPQVAHQQVPALPPQPLAQPQAVYQYHQQVVTDGSIVYHFPVAQPNPGTSTNMYR